MVDILVLLACALTGVAIASGFEACLDVFLARKARNPRRSYVKRDTLSTIARGLGL